MRRRYKKTKVKKRKISLSMKLMYLVLLSLLVVNFSISRYATTHNIAANSNNAKWTFKVNDKNKSEQKFTINLADTAIESSQYDSSKKIIAPGAKGKFTIAIDCTNSDVAVNYKIVLKENSQNEIPVEMMFYSKQLNNGQIPLINIKNSSGKIPEERNVTGYISLDKIRTNPIYTLQVDWLWQVNKDRDESKFEGKDFLIDIVVTGEQVIE